GARLRGVDPRHARRAPGPAVPPRLGGAHRASGATRRRRARRVAPGPPATMRALLASCVALAFGSLVWAEPGAPPVDFKIAFIGDQGLGPNAQAVLTLIRDEGASAVLHSGDFDYTDSPAAWDDQINGVLGANFPYFATAHEHSYSRTYLLSSCQNQTVASTASTLVLSRDDPGTRADEGRSFVFVSGLGGSSIRPQLLDGPWWASVYTSTQGANYGALF